QKIFSEQCVIWTLPHCAISKKRINGVACEMRWKAEAGSKLSNHGEGNSSFTRTWGIGRENVKSAIDETDEKTRELHCRSNRIIYTDTRGSLHGLEGSKKTVQP